MFLLLALLLLQNPFSQITVLPTVSAVVGSREQHLLLPLFTSARHNSSCPHTYSIRKCPGATAAAKTQAGIEAFGEQGLCFVWVAGSDLPAGAEVCVSYGHLRPDQSVLQYGLDLELPYHPHVTVVPGPGSSSIEQGEEHQDSMACDAQDAATTLRRTQQVPLSGLDTTASSSDSPFAPVSFQPLTPAPLGKSELETSV